MLLALLAAAWLAGMFLGAAFQASPLPLLLFGLAALPLALLLRLCRRPLWPALLAGTLLLGFGRWEWAQAVPDPLVSLAERDVVLEGWVAGDPEATAQRVRFVLAVTAVEQGESRWTSQGRVLVYAYPPPALAAAREPPYYRYGDGLRLQGVLERPQAFDAFDYPAWLAGQGIWVIMRPRHAEWLGQGQGNPLLAQVFAVRHGMAQSLEVALPAPEAGLAQALVLGLRGGLPPQVVEDFRRTGTSHLLAISGLQVSVLLALALGVSGWLLGKRRQAYLLAPLALVWAYALVSGLAPPVARAAVMGSVYLAALALGRPRSVLPALALAAAAMTALQPRLLTDVSFQLSFAAMAGLALAAPLQDRFRTALGDEPGDVASWGAAAGRRLLAGTVVALVVSAAATLATLPLVAFTFHQAPLSGVFVTVLALPVQTVMLAASAATALAGLLHPALGQALGWLAWLPLAGQKALVTLAPGPVVAVPWAGPWSAALVAVWYLALAGLMLWPPGWGRVRLAPGWLEGLVSGLFTQPFQGDGSNKASRGAPWGYLVLAVPMALAGGLLWARVLDRPDGRLHVYFLDVGQGDAILVVTPQGRQVLVDGGPGTESAVRALAGPMPPWDRSLDLVVLTHLDADHAQGLLEVLARHRVGAVLSGVEDEASPLLPQWRAAVLRSQARHIRVAQGHRIALEEGVYLEVLNPPQPPWRGTGADGNNNGVVLRLVYGETRFLLAADIEAAAEGRLARLDPRSLSSQVLKVAHHGSQTSSTEAFLRAVAPSLAVISAGEDNRYGHPHPTVVSRLAALAGEDRVVRTDRHGPIEVASDGRTLWLDTSRSP